MLSRIHLLASFVILSFAAVAARAETSAADSAAQQFKTLLDDAWEFRLQEDPLFATETGDHGADDKLPAVSLADEERRGGKQREFLKRLEGIDREALEPTDRLNYDIFGR